MDRSVHPLSTLDPSAALDDLEPLARLIGDDVRVVAVGESAHGAHEFYALRHRLIRFLVERMNFSAVVWESGFPETFAVDDYIHGRRDDRDRVLIDGMTMNMGRCDEMGDLLDWLRAHNASASRTPGENDVQFYGLDLPGASVRPALGVVTRYVEQVDPGFGPRLARLRALVDSLGPDASPPDKSAKLAFAGTSVVRQYLALSAVDRNELTALLADLAARFDALERTYVERSDSVRYELARRHLRVAMGLDLQLRAVAALMSGDASACDANIRDATMADTVEWILRKHRRIVVLAHNGHIQRTPISTPSATAPSVDTIGVHLARRLGDQYLTVGTTCGSGDIIAMRGVPGTDGSPESELYIRDLPSVEADTIDALLDKQFSVPTLLDLRHATPQVAAALDAASTMRMQDQLLKIDVRRSFDLLVHVPRISIWTSEANAGMADLRASKE